MLYPNNIKKKVKRNISFANRGMDLETLINEANEFYLKEDIAVIYKKPTPVKIKKVTYTNDIPKVEGYLNQKSTLDYVGLYKGKYIDFDAKKTLNLNSFPLSNIHLHQLNHMKMIIKHEGITFLLIDIQNKVFLLKGEDIINSSIIEGLSNVDTIKGSHLEKRLIDLFTIKYKSFQENNYSLSLLITVQEFIKNLIYDILIILIYAFGSYFVIK